MTLDKLLGGSASYLESLTDAELKAFFEPYLKTTRPSPEQEKLRKIANKPKEKAEDPIAKAKRLYKERFGTELNL